MQWKARVRRFGSTLAAGWLVLPLLPLLSGTAQGAGLDDRPAIEGFVTTGVVSSRRLQDDLARAQWPAGELRAAAARAYGISTRALDRYLATPAGRNLLSRAVPWWSPDLSPQVRLAALQAALLADSRDGSMSLLGVLQQLPVRFALGRAEPSEAQSCGCPTECGSSALAQLAFLIACLQAGSMQPAQR